MLLPFTLTLRKTTPILCIPLEQVLSRSEERGSDFHPHSVIKRKVLISFSGCTQFLHRAALPFTGIAAFLAFFKKHTILLGWVLNSYVFKYNEEPQCLSFPVLFTVVISVYLYNYLIYDSTMMRIPWRQSYVWFCSSLHSEHYAVCLLHIRFSINGRKIK